MAEIDSGLVIDDFQKQFMENAANPVPLHPELESFVFRDGSKLGWDMLKHPLVFGVPYTPGMNFLYNRQFEAKTQALREYALKEDWGGFVFMHERPHRLDAFEAIHHKLDGPKYWELMTSVWLDSENLWQVGFKRLRKLLKLHPDHRDCFMDDDEKELLQSLPDKVRVFRGHQGRNRRGFSWTLEYNTAVWFSKRFAKSGHGRVSQGMVLKSDIIGLIMGRGEMEVVVDPRNVQDLHLILVEKNLGDGSIV